MKKMLNIINEYKEIIAAFFFGALFWAILPMAEPWTAGASSDWIFRLPILGAIAFSLPTLTEWVWRRTFISLAQKKNENKKLTNNERNMIYFTYAATLVAIAILAHALV